MQSIHGIGATCADAIVHRNMSGRRRPPKFGGGSPFPAAEDVVDARGKDAHPALEH